MYPIPHSPALQKKNMLDRWEEGERIYFREKRNVQGREECKEEKRGGGERVGRQRRRK